MTTTLTMNQNQKKMPRQSTRSNPATTSAYASTMHTTARWPTNAS